MKNKDVVPFEVISTQNVYLNYIKWRTEKDFVSKKRAYKNHINGSNECKTIFYMYNDIISMYP